MNSALKKDIPSLCEIPAGMVEVDRIGWTAGLTFLAYGRRMGVRVNDSEILPLLTKHLPYSWKPARGHSVEKLYSMFTSGRQHNPKSRRAHVLFAGAVELARSLRLRDVFELFERDARTFVAEHARRRVFVHAAAVRVRSGALARFRPAWALCHCLPTQ